MTKQEQIARFEASKLFAMSKGDWKLAEFFDSKIRALSALPIEKEVGQ